MPVIAGRSIRCILFDLGSTLWVRQEEMAAQAEARAYTAAGALLRRVSGDSASSTGDALALGRVLYETIGRHIYEQELQKPGYEPDFAAVTLQALRQLGFMRSDLALGARLFEMLRIRIPDSRVLFADTLSTLAELKGRGYLLGVVTNRAYGGPLFHADLQTMGLLDPFEYRHMAISADLGIRKPHPEIFRYALNSLHVPPTEAAMVGDNFVADVVGARRLEMLAIWKPNPWLSQEEQRPPEHANVVPDAIITHIADLLEIF